MTEDILRPRSIAVVNFGEPIGREVAYRSCYGARGAHRHLAKAMLNAMSRLTSTFSKASKVADSGGGTGYRVSRRFSVGGSLAAGLWAVRPNGLVHVHTHALQHGAGRDGPAGRRRGE